MEIDLDVQPGTGFVVVHLSGVLSMQTVAATRAALAQLLTDSERVVADLSHLQLRHPECVTVFGTALRQAGGWPEAKLALIGADPRMLTHLARSKGPVVPVAGTLNAALVMADQPPGSISSRFTPVTEPRRDLVTAIAKTHPEAAQFIQNWLGVVIEHDVREQGALVTTLAAFLEANQDYDRTARVLGIHRSTARYRIHRVAQLTQLDLRDPATIQSLASASRLLAWLSDARY